MVTERYGQFDPQGKNQTLSRTFRRYNSLPPALSPLQEGVTPAGQKLTKTDIKMQLQQYGDFAEITDVIMDTHEDPVLQEGTDICAEQAAETVELIRIAVLCGGTTVFYANGVTSRAAVDSPPLSGDFRKIKRFFDRHRARPITKIIKASVNIATEPVAPAFICLCHTDLEPDLTDLTRFVPLEKYSSAMKAQPGEIGKIDSFRFITTSLFTPWYAAGASGTTYLSDGQTASVAAKCDVYPIICLARDAYGIVPMTGQKNVDVFAVSPKPSDSDKLGQRGHVGWKTYQGAVILNDQFIARYEVAATADPE
jgi:N4-gp56 family major capsid protein